MKESLLKIKKSIEAGEAILVDVREDSEWSEGHLKLAKFLPLSELEQGIADLDEFEKNKKMILHCRSGRRTLLAEEILKAEGFEVESLAEGFLELAEEGFDVENEF